MPLAGGNAGGVLYRLCFVFMSALHRHTGAPVFPSVQGTPRRPANPIARKFNIDALRKARTRGVSGPVDAVALAIIARST